MTFEMGDIKDLWTIITEVGKQIISKNLRTSCLMFSVSHFYSEVGPIKKLGQFLLEPNTKRLKLLPSAFIIIN